MKNKRGAIYLLLAIFFEVFATTNMKLSEGFSIIEYNLAVVIGVLCSIYFFALSLEELPLTIAYAIWVGLGTVLITIIGIVLFKEVVGGLRTLGLVMVIIGVISLNYYFKDTKEKQKMKEKSA
ncbi:hypothetical protein BKP45_13550 [Anaerobacillus alkalidiazotrophicus]|uniref:QacE family quaternary ammonium compound efflux SMR transporter n=1 Tax=Anaerobacillus alkalidiazotrophicus TaxID=472963 RepID=A0A1S2M4S9_9BACI|nr:multidrug efflux SMR transporter [Anaerobacillus alkalidiazotrophicus]OIJ19463.1 hypothetical protein BKP45_13550 [Anaerobacillus alkalidiazotrophicus]